jgi:two-component sensor histidine kinase
MSLAEPFLPQAKPPLRESRNAAPSFYESASDENPLEVELAEMRELQAISTRLIQEDAAGLHDAILDAAQKLLRSDMATMQLYDATRDGLTLLSWRGFDPKHIVLFDWVGRNAGTSCAAALRAGARVVIPDIELDETIAGTPSHDALRVCGIRAAQSTPLITRKGDVIGMITNHWRQPHRPSERALQMIDVLARQAADLIDRSRNEDRIVVLAREAEHRAKNMLAAVQAIVRLTKAPTAEALKQTITGRINALNNVHRLFVKSNWQGADLRTLAAEELMPFCKGEDFKADLGGPDIMLDPNTAQAISMILHELATNAAKYGALSVPGGHVGVHWLRGEDGRMTLRWTERGGPAAEAPSTRGIGTGVMERMVRGQLNGAIKFDWRAEGLTCEFSMPV